MKQPVANYGDSVRARLLAIANREHLQLEYLLLRYAVERFLWRLGKSRYADRFILKGASAFAVWTGLFGRMTRDADFAAFGEPDSQKLIAAFKDVCAIPCPSDAVVFDQGSFQSESIKKGDGYPGTRIRFTATIGGAHVALQFDIGFGDIIHPFPEKMEYPILLDGEKPLVRIYPIYAAISEKFQVMVARGMANSRLKDYYDIWYLAEHCDIDNDVLACAIRKTFQRRGTPIPMRLPTSLTEQFYENDAKQTQWNAFLRKMPSKSRPDSMKAVVERICALLEPIIVQLAENSISDSVVDGDQRKV